MITSHGYWYYLLSEKPGNAKGRAPLQEAAFGELYDCYLPSNAEKE